MSCVFEKKKKKLNSLITKQMFRQTGQSLLCAKLDSNIEHTGGI